MISSIPTGSDRPARLTILGSRIDRVTFPDALHRIDALLAQPGAHQVITGNTLMILAAQTDAELRATLEGAALVVPESSGISWASRILGSPLHEFVPGIDLFTALCHLARDRQRSIYLLGARPGVAESAARTLQALVPGLVVAGTHHGYFPPSETMAVLTKIRSARPTFLFVGMSVPEQDKWIFRHREALGIPIIMGVGGSFDVLSGNLRRAPVWMRRWGIEWAFRLVQEPWRWRRIAELPIFALKVLTSRLGGAKARP